MLKLSREGTRITIETGSGIATWDSARGGQIVAFACKDERHTRPLLSDGDCIPGLRFVIDGKAHVLAEIHSKLEVTTVEEGERIVLTNTTELADGNIQLVQIYEAFAEGAIFCEQQIEVPEGRRFGLSEASMHLRLDVRSARSARWGNFERNPWYKRDYSTTHVFYGKSLFKTLDETTEARELWPLASIDLGWEETKFFSNKIEFVLEEWTSFNDVSLDNTLTRGGGENGRWGLHFYFHEGNTLDVNSACRYRNRWGLLFLTARTRSGKDEDPALRNNALGCRIAHCMYPYAREGNQWPWVVMPIKQVACQAPQLYRGNPEIARVDEAADLGANLMIIHQFWMANPGTNNEPPADYHINDPEWFRAFVARCHERGLRVLTYVRGTEVWHMYSSFWEDTLQRDWDGLYPDWNSPHAMGFCKTSPIHWSAYAYFQYARAMRRRVGDGGVIIGHTGNSFGLAQACIDVALGGEFSVQHDQLLKDPESTAYYGFLSCSGGHLISGNLPDRVLFSGPKAAAVCNAFGMTGHPFMEPDIPFSKVMAYIKPLWDSLTSMPGTIARIHNPAYSPTLAVSCGEFWLFPSLWQSSEHKGLLLVTNLHDTDEQSGTVQLDLRELDVPAGAAVKALDIAGTQPGCAKVDGTRARIKGLPALSFCALSIG